MRRTISALLPMAAACCFSMALVAAPPRNPTPPNQPPTQPTPPAEGSIQHVVRLLEAGESPQELRLAPAANLAQRSEAVVKMSMSMMGMSMDMPAMRIVTDNTVNKVAPETGEISYHFEITEAELVDAQNADPMMVQGMQQAIAGMVGTNGDLTISNRGLPIGEADIEMTGDELPGMDPNSMAMGIPLPEEPVGVGGSWEVKTNLTQQGISIEQTAVYEIVSINDGTLQLKVSITQTAPAQQISQQGMTMLLKEFSSQGSGSGTIRLDEVVGQDMSMTMNTSIVMEAMGQEMAQQMSIETTLTSERIEGAAGGDGG